MIKKLKNYSLFERCNNSSFARVYSLSSKPIYVVEDHSTAIISWGLIRRHIHNTKNPFIIAFDTHTDFDEAFLYETGVPTMSVPGNKNYPLKNVCPKSYIRKETFAHQIDYMNDLSLIGAAHLLKNTEQYRAGIAGNIISEVHHFSYSERDNVEKIYNYHVDDKYKECCLSDDVFLNYAIDIDKLIIDNDYIIDIDLDYFQSKLDLINTNTSYFDKLLKGCSGISIALETECFKEESRKFNEELELEGTLEHLIGYITSIIKNY
jgi:hypothetical protein